DLADRQEHSLPNARSFSTTNRSQPKKPKRLCGSQAASILKVRNLGLIEYGFRRPPKNGEPSQIRQGRTVKMVAMSTSHCISVTLQDCSFILRKGVYRLPDNGHIVERQGAWYGNNAVLAEDGEITITKHMHPPKSSRSLILHR
ncbi:MAG: hypothetical protein ACRC67_41135, partial [Inquilinus sp.]|uniref:hypothetical protein n=1 Tax=Inquilinus sp. TaxID=1932117 RepID=UPI003F2CE9DD